MNPSGERGGGMNASEKRKVNTNEAVSYGSRICCFDFRPSSKIKPDKPLLNDPVDHDRRQHQPVLDPWDTNVSRTCWSVRSSVLRLTIAILVGVWALAVIRHCWRCMLRWKYPVKER